MANTQETLAAVLWMLRASGLHCDIFGGWAVELLGLRDPWQHGDIDLLYRGDNFTLVDLAITACKDVQEVAAKRFWHKRAFFFQETLCELILVHDADTRPITYYWGDVPFLWNHPLLHNRPIQLCGESVTAVSASNLRRHRFRWKDTQPYRWRDPQSLQV